MDHLPRYRVDLISWGTWSMMLRRVAYTGHVCLVPLEWLISFLPIAVRGPLCMGLLPVLGHSTQLFGDWRPGTHFSVCVNFDSNR